MAITIEDIANQVGVTKTTVSLVLKDPDKKTRISEKTSGQIKKVAQQLGYRPSFIAQSLAMGRTASFGFVCGGIDSPFFSEITMLALRQAENRAHHLLLAATYWQYQRELECFDMLLRRGVDGIMIVSDALKPNTELYEYICQHQFPVVRLLGINDCQLPQVYSDYTQGMEQAIVHFKKQGHRAVGYIGDQPAKHGKITAIRRACEKYGVRLSQHPCDLTIGSAVRAGEQFAQMENRPAAVIACSDHTAIGFMRGLTKQGLHTPRDVAVVGIDDTQIGEMMNPPLTSIAHEKDELIGRALDWLVEMSTKKELFLNKKMKLATKLIVRESA